LSRWIGDELRHTGGSNNAASVKAAHYTFVICSPSSAILSFAQAAAMFWPRCAVMDGRLHTRSLHRARRQVETPRSFLLFTVYLDEADTHGPSPTIIMTAMLGSARQWQLFERKLRKLQRAEEFKVFHGKDIKAFSGEFRGWSDRRGRHVVMELTRLIRDELTAGMSIHLDYESYVKIYRNSFTPRIASMGCVSDYS
jgi:hypothetical protein